MTKDEKFLLGNMLKLEAQGRPFTAAGAAELARLKTLAKGDATLKPEPCSPWVECLPNETEEAAKVRHAAECDQRIGDFLRFLAEAATRFGEAFVVAALDRAAPLAGDLLPGVLK